MSEPTNIEAFKLVAGKILGTLYASHPIAQWDDASLINGAEADDDDEELYSATVEYLFENEYITKPQVGYIRLRDKGYEALSKPNPLQPTQSFGSSLAYWVKRTGSNVANDGIGELVSCSLKALFAAFKSGT